MMKETTDPADTTQSEAKHTPGEWTIESPTRSAFLLPIVDERRTYICAVSERPMQSEQNANARLIAAAPELLAVLKRLDAHLDFSEPWEVGAVSIADASGINEAMQQARAAIAKAEGR